MTDRTCDVAILHYLLGETQGPALHALAESLRHDPTARRKLIQITRIAGALTVHREALAASPAATKIQATPDRPVRGFRFPFWPLALAAMLMLAAAGVTAYLISGSFVPSEVDDPSVSAGPMVVTLIDTTGGATVYAGDDIAYPGSDYAAGDYAIDSGSAELLLTSGAGVELIGDTRLIVHDPMTATLTHGSARFRCPASAVGFAVALPGGASVIDLGTRFQIQVETGGRTVVDVIEGTVEAREAIASGAGRIVETGRRVVLSGDGAIIGVYAAAAGDDLVVNGSMDDPRLESGGVAVDLVAKVPGWRKHGGYSSGAGLVHADHPSVRIAPPSGAQWMFINDGATVYQPIRPGADADSIEVAFTLGGSLGVEPASTFAVVLAIGGEGPRDWTVVDRVDAAASAIRTPAMSQSLRQTVTLRPVRPFPADATVWLAFVVDDSPTFTRLLLDDVSATALSYRPVDPTQLPTSHESRQRDGATSRTDP